MSKYFGKLIWTKMVIISAKECWNRFLFLWKIWTKDTGEKLNLNEFFLNIFNLHSVQKQPKWRHLIIHTHSQNDCQRVSALPFVSVICAKYFFVFSKSYKYLQDFNGHCNYTTWCGNGELCPETRILGTSLN